jgi:hypothetical protein
VLPSALPEYVFAVIPTFCSTHRFLVLNVHGRPRKTIHRPTQSSQAPLTWDRLWSSFIHHYHC